MDGFWLRLLTARLTPHRPDLTWVQTQCRDEEPYWDNWVPCEYEDDRELLLYAALITAVHC